MLETLAGLLKQKRTLDEAHFLFPFPSLPFLSALLLNLALTRTSLELVLNSSNMKTKRGQDLKERILILKNPVLDLREKLSADASLAYSVGILA